MSESNVDGKFPRIISDTTKTAAEEDEDYEIGSLFINEDYILKTFHFPTASLELLCSNMSTTDHDLTGQIVWPASLFLCYYIAANREKFTGKNIVELGAGCGLAGFLAAQYAKVVYITDGNEIVLKLLQMNKSHYENNGTTGMASVAIEQLLWGIPGEVERIFGKKAVSNEINEYETNYPDVIIGADVILWPNFVAPLLTTVKLLLSYRPRSSICYISYIVRANSTTDLLYNFAERIGLRITTVDMSAAMASDGIPKSLINLEKYILEISIDESATIPLDIEDDQFSVAFSLSAAPC